MALTEALPTPTKPSIRQQLMGNSSVMIGGVIVAMMILVALAAPFLGTRDPAEINPSYRNKTPGFTATIRDDDGNKVPVAYRFGTDSLGRDIYSRSIYGARVSLIVGLTVSVISISIGLVIGLLAGYIRWLDGIIMRIMDGL
ncbi:MAG: ABC transporter permease, partial [Alphaproteobacteria bacterium]|nr:ABC transporter permease [Alphaproteobacteria bacterium]